MKKLLKSEVCRSRALFMRPTNGLKMAEKSKFSTTVHAQYMNSSLCLQLCVQKKKKKKRGKTHRRIQRKMLNPNGHYIRAPTSVVAKICKMQEVHNFAHSNHKKTPTLVFVKMCIYTLWLCKWTVTVHICTVIVHRVNDFLFFFSLSSTKLLLFPNVYNKLARHNKKEEENNFQT